MSAGETEPTTESNFADLRARLKSKWSEAPQSMTRRLLGLIGANAMQFISIEVERDDADWKGNIVIFTDTTVFTQTFSCAFSSPVEVNVQVWPRKALISIDTSDRTVPNDPDTEGTRWEKDDRLKLTYEGRRDQPTVLPSGDHERTEWLGFLPSLVADLSR